MTPRRKGIWTISLVIAIVLIILIGIVGFVLYSSVSAEEPLPTTESQTTISPNPGGSSTTATGNTSSSDSGTIQTSTSNQSNESTSARELVPMGATCVTVVPYDSIGKLFGGCGYTFAVLFNGAPYTQTLSNGSVEMNSRWTLLMEVSQNSGPSENTSFGWDPGGPGGASGERLPVPMSSTLLGGNVTLQWRLYGSTPQLYAWIIVSTPGASQQTTSTETTSTSCPTASWPSQVSISYQPVVQQIEQNPAFIGLTGGLCYSFALNYSGVSAGQSLATFVFNQYNGTIVYPCGYFPANLIVSQIQVTVFNGTTFNEINSMWLENDTSQLNVSSCPLTNYPVSVQSVILTPPYTPAGPTVEITLRGNIEQMPITNLTAILSLTGRNQTFQFSGVNASSPLLYEQFKSQTEIIVGPVSIDSSAIYPMTITGTFENGQTFSFDVQVQVQSAPQS